MDEFGYKYFPLSYVWMGGVEGGVYEIWKESKRENGWNILKISTFHPLCSSLLPLNLPPSQAYLWWIGEKYCYGAWDTMVELASQATAPHKKKKKVTSPTKREILSILIMRAIWRLVFYILQNVSISACQHKGNWD